MKAIIIIIVIVVAAGAGYFIMNFDDSKSGLQNQKAEQKDKPNISTEDSKIYKCTKTTKLPSGESIITEYYAPHKFRGEVQNLKKALPTTVYEIMRDGFLYTWTVLGNGVVFEDSLNRVKGSKIPYGEIKITPEIYYKLRPTTNPEGCTIWTGGEAIFDLPADISFSDGYYGVQAK